MQEMWGFFQFPCFLLCPFLPVQGVKDMAYVCDSIQVVDGLATCVAWIQQVEPEFNLLNISVADANLLLSQVCLCFATVFLYNVVNDAFKGK